MVNGDFERVPGFVTPTQRQALGVALIDFDDTLVDTQPVYDEARDMAKGVVTAAVRRQVPDPVAFTAIADRWEELSRLFDVDNVQHFWLNRNRFPTTQMQAYRAIATELRTGVLVNVVDKPGLTMDTVATSTLLPVYADVLRQLREDDVRVELDSRAEHSVFDAGEYFLRAVTPVLPGVEEGLRELQPYVRLVLLTKGDVQVQIMRAHDSGLMQWFDDAFVVGDKSVNTFRGIAQAEGLDTDRIVSIGNSFGSDIAPAVQAGMHGLWIDRPTWEYERQKSERVRQMANLDLEMQARIVAVDSFSGAPEAVSIALGVPLEGRTLVNYASGDRATHVPSPVSDLLVRMAANAADDGLGL